jgi:N-acetylneuraminic acid mutarotase
LPSIALVALLTLAAGPQQSEQYVLDLHAGVWSRGPSLPEARQDSAAVELGGRIYIIGGFGADGRSTDTTFVLEPAPGTNLAPKPDELVPPTVPLGSWMSAQPIPETVDHAAAAALDGYIYVAGGRIENVVTNKFWRYDPADDTWVELPSMPVPRYGPSLEAAASRLYVVGGTASHGHDERSIEVFDPATSQWSIIDNALGVEREGSSSVTVGGRIAIIGGRDSNERNMTACDLFDPTNGKLYGCSNMHAGRSGFGLAAVGNRLMAIGGVNLLSGLATQTMEISGENAQGWMDGRWLPAPRQGMSVAVLGHTV